MYLVASVFAFGWVSGYSFAHAQLIRGVFALLFAMWGLATVINRIADMVLAGHRTASRKDA